jgi:tripartite-type tricarboxylate transporter receptor subunit TctC
MKKALENPTFRQRLLDSGLTPNFEDMAAFNRRIANDLKSWGDVIRAAGIKAD